MTPVSDGSRHAHESGHPTTRFDHVGISVPDLEAATQWYCETLELTAAPMFSIPGTDLRGVMLLHASGYRIELIHRRSATTGIRPDSALDAAAIHGFGHMCLCVQDVRAEFDRLVAAGASVRLVPSPAPRAGATFAFVSDPWGNLIELLDRN